MNRGLRIAPLICCVLLAHCASFQKREARPSLGEKEWTSHDGKQMPWQAALPPQGEQLKGVVITVHGLSGAASDFWLLQERLPPAGFAVYGYELRGQGHDPSQDDRGDIRSSRQWLRDLETFHLLVRKRHPRAPVFWYGESLGSLIAFHTAAHLGAARDPDGLILASPVAGLRMAVSGFQKWFIKTAATVAPGQRYSLGELAGADESKFRVTATSTHGGQMEKTPHHVETFTLRLLGEIGRLMDDNARSARRLHLPVLFLASPNDVLSSPDQVQTLFKQIASTDKELHWYTRSYHLLLHDVQHEEVVRDVLKWLRDETKKKP